MTASTRYQPTRQRGSVRGDPRWRVGLVWRVCIPSVKCSKKAMHRPPLLGDGTGTLLRTSRSGGRGRARSADDRPEVVRRREARIGIDRRILTTKSTKSTKGDRPDDRSFDPFRRTDRRILEHGTHGIHGSRPEDRFGFLNTEHTESTETDRGNRPVGRSPSVRRRRSVTSAESAERAEAKTRERGDGPIG